MKGDCQKKKQMYRYRGPYLQCIITASNVLDCRVQLYNQLNESTVGAISDTNKSKTAWNKRCKVDYSVL